LFSLLLHRSPQQEDLLVADLFEWGATGIAEEEQGIRAFFDGDADCTTLLARFRDFAPEVREEQAVDWAAVSRDAFPPLLIGQQFYLVAPWDASETPEGRLRLEIEPGMACGTGRHPATQLCLEALEASVTPGVSVLDVGTGSGILSEAARLLGAGRVIGCDIDLEAVQIARERIGVTLFAGSADAIRARSQEIIVANIDSAAIESLAGELSRIRKPQSKLILSGFPKHDLPAGFQPQTILTREEWACLIC